MATRTATPPAGGEACDATLAAEMVGGSSRAFDELYRRHADAVHQVGSHVLRNPEAADDLTQDVFMRLWSGRHLYNQELASIRTWVLVIARNRAVDLARTRGRDVRLLAAIQQTEWRREHAPDALSETLTRDRMLELNTALAELPNAQRVALVLTFGAGLSNGEVAQRTGAPLGTVKGRLRLGQRRLALRMEQEIP